MRAGPDGYVDYESALNARLGKGIVPEKNAVALISKALGPKFKKEPLPAEFFKLLGIAELPPNGEYFVGLYPFLKNQPELSPDEFASIFGEQSTWASERPWKAKDYPYIAAWLKANEKPLAMAIEAARLPDYFYPVVTRRTKNGSRILIDSRYPHIGQPRELASAWETRSMLAIGEGRMDAAWQDLLACHRLGRMISRGATLMDVLVGMSFENIAMSRDLIYLERANLSAQQIRVRLKDLRDLPPMVPFADVLALGERYNVLDEIQRGHRGGPEAIAEAIEFDLALRGIHSVDGDRTGPRKLSAAEKQALAALDWEALLRTFNRRYDALLPIVRNEDRLSREKEFSRIAKELNEKKPSTPNALLAALGPQGSSKAASLLYGEIWADSIFTTVRQIQAAMDRMEQTRRNLHVAFALALYHREHGRYPAKLDDLVPKYEPAIPMDLFSGQPLRYRPTDKGYLLYSVGKNGIDDGGQTSLWDRPPGDDLAVRIPVPELKKDE